MGGSAFAVARSVASFWQLAVTAEGLRDDTAAGSAVPRVPTSALNAVTTALLVVAHFTVPVTLLATVVDVATVVVVELLVGRGCRTSGNRYRGDHHGKSH